MAALVQVAALRQKNGGGAICPSALISPNLLSAPGPAAERHASATTAAAAVFDTSLSCLFLFMDTSRPAFKRTPSVKAIEASPH